MVFPALDWESRKWSRGDTVSVAWNNRILGGTVVREGPALFEVTVRVSIDGVSTTLVAHRFNVAPA